MPRMLLFCGNQLPVNPVTPVVVLYYFTLASARLFYLSKEKRLSVTRLNSSKEYKSGQCGRSLGTLNFELQFFNISDWRPDAAKLNYLPENVNKGYLCRANFYHFEWFQFYTKHFKQASNVQAKYLNFFIILITNSNYHLQHVHPSFKNYHNYIQIHISYALEIQYRRLG